MALLVGLDWTEPFVSQPYSDYPLHLHQLSQQTRRGETEELSGQVGGVV
jgi:hypothetical protein